MAGATAAAVMERAAILTSFEAVRRERACLWILLRRALDRNVIGRTWLCGVPPWTLGFLVL